MVLALLAAALPFSAAGEEPVRSAQISRVEGAAPIIDGVLDEEVWSRATQLTGFRQVNPDEGEPATQRTELYVFFDSNFLYVGARCWDTNPELLITKQMRRDVSMTSDDRLNLIFDTFHDQRNGYFFQINPLGARSEALIENNQSFRREWDGIWSGAATIDADGWTAEVAIPFKTVPFDGEGRVWGFEAERIIRRNNETTRWANFDRNRSVTTISGIGTLEGFADLEGVAVDVKPSMAAIYSRARTEDRTVFEGKPSLDVFYKFTAALTASLTLNTDFSAAPVDVRQTNLSGSAS